MSLDAGAVAWAGAAGVAGLANVIWLGAAGVTGLADVAGLGAAGIAADERAPPRSIGTTIVASTKLS